MQFTSAKVRGETWFPKLWSVEFQHQLFPLLWLFTMDIEHKDHQQISFRYLENFRNFPYSLNVQSSLWIAQRCEIAKVRRNHSENTCFFRFRHNVITLVPIRMNFCETLASSFTLIGQVLVDPYHLQLTMLEDQKSQLVSKCIIKFYFLYNYWLNNCKKEQLSLIFKATETNKR